MDTSEQKEAKMVIENVHIPAYTISNENQRWATTALSGANRVLTVTGSGDQALFYTLAGAKHIDTFDITPNAGVIQNIKYAAIKYMDSPEQYRELLISLYSVRDIRQVPGMEKLKTLFTKESCKVIDFCSEHKIYMFRAELNADCYLHNIPTSTEYAKLKEALKKPINFIECDLCDLSGKISGKYDVINLSNIFDAGFDSSAQAKILMQLAKHLNNGGHIVYLPQLQRYKYDGVRLPVGQKSELVYQETLHQGTNSMILFKRQHIR